MLENLIDILSDLDTFFWGRIAFLLILVLGSYLTIQMRFFQIREIAHIGKFFFSLMRGGKEKRRGVHPIRAFFASVGGMIGIGNVVGIATAVQIGGPGALFWVWVAGVIGSIVKYAEIYLGVKYRVENGQGGYDGGPMYFLKAAFNIKFLPFLVAGLLCIYGVEIYQFSVICDSLVTNLHWNRAAVIFTLLAAILYASLGGVNRLGKFSSIFLPLFILIYLAMALFVLWTEAASIPSMLSSIFTTAFTGHAAIGGFAGSSMLLAIQHGLSRSAYSADIGIGYDSIIQSETNVSHPTRQGYLAIFGVFIDNLICTLTIFIVLLSNAWKAEAPLKGSEIVQVALSQYFPLMHYFMPLFLTILGYTTITAFFCVGMKCARFLFPKRGHLFYVLYGTMAFIFFAFSEQENALLIMSLSGACLLIINLLGIFRLRKEIVAEPLTVTN